MILNFKLMVSSKTKCRSHFFYIYNWFQQTFLHCLWEVCNLEHSVRTQSRVPNNDEHKWTPRPGEKNRGRGREINGLQENVSEAERGKKDVYICSSMQSAHVCVCEPSVMYSRQQWWMRPFFHTPVLSLQVYQQFCCRQTREGLFHCSLLWLFWKWVALRINLLCWQHKYGVPEKENTALIYCQVQTCLEMVLMMCVTNNNFFIFLFILILTCYPSSIPWF